MRAVLREKRRPSDRPENFFLVQDTVATATAGMDGGSLRVKRDALTAEERVTVIELTRQATRDGALHLEVLSAGERRRWEHLVEKGAGREPGSVFEHQRELARVRPQLRELLRNARKPDRRLALAEPGSVTLTREWCFEWLAETEPVLWLQHLALLVFVLAQLENGEALTPGGRIEGAGDTITLVIDNTLGLGQRFDDEERLGGWRRDLQHLHANELLDVHRHGQKIHIGFGRRYHEAFPRKHTA